MTIKRAGWLASVAILLNTCGGCSRHPTRPTGPRPTNVGRRTAAPTSREAAPRQPLPESSPYYIRSRSVPAEFDVPYRFLEFIKHRKVPEDFSPGDAPRWDVPRFMSYISTRGVRFTDVNEDGGGHLSWREIEKELTARRGRAFETFAHLSYIYSTPYEQYSEMRFGREGQTLILKVSDWYHLTFAPEGGALRLTDCDYLMQEGD